MTNRTMNPYMAFSRHEGSHEGAILVMHRTAKQARSLAWRSNQLLYLEDWLDLGVNLIRDRSVLALADQDLLNAGKPHVISSPVACHACGFWGCGLTKDNLCGNCNEAPGEELVRLYTSSFKD